MVSGPCKLCVTVTLTVPPVPCRTFTWLFALLARQSLKELRETSFRKTPGGMGSSSGWGMGSAEDEARPGSQLPGF